MSLINVLIAAATRETRILSEGLSSLAERASFLAAARRASTNSTRVSRIATRAKMDLALAIPWVPILAIVPGSAFLMAFASAVAPITLPSTFTAARARLTASSSIRGSGANAAEMQLRKSIQSAGLSRRVDSEATGEAALKPLGIRALKSVALFYSNPSSTMEKNQETAAIQFNDAIILDDAALRIQEALKEGPFAMDDSAVEEALQACTARGLNLLVVVVVVGNCSNADLLHAWLSLRREFAPAQLYAALNAAACGTRITD